jgi:hypothetical protein
VRPITKPAVLPNYAVPAHGVSALYNAMSDIVAPTGAPYRGTAQFTLNEYASVLDFLQRIVITNTGANDLHGTLITPADATNLIQQIYTAANNLKLDDVYGSARLDMISALGQYCSFCEMPVGDSSLAIEHMLPKSAFLNLAVLTANFLLACPVCNSKKSNNPVSQTPLGGGAPFITYQWPINWSTPLIPSVPVGMALKPASWPDYLNTEQVLFNAYMWPQYTGSYQSFDQQLAIYAGAALGYQYTQPNRLDTITTIQGQTITALLHGVRAGHAIPEDVSILTISRAAAFIQNNSVPVVAHNFLAPPAGVFPNSATMVGAFNFGTGRGLIDFNDTTTGTYFTDRRMFNRTKAWFNALYAFNRLNSAQAISPPGAPPGPTQAYTILMQEVCSTASANGFFSVWVTVFNTFAPAVAGAFGPTPAGGGLPNLTCDFINGVTVNAPVGGGFPGTNIINSVP